MTALLVVCGALAREVVALRDRHGWEAEIRALPASLHNRPAKIPEAVKRLVESAAGDYQPVVVVYGDCGTGGALRSLLRERGWRGLAAPHCYAAFAGESSFERLVGEALGTFFLTDYLVQSFDHLVIEGLGLDRYPELHQDYFGRYERALYLQQRRDPRLLEKARGAARFLKLPLEVRYTGLAELERRIGPLLDPERPDPAAANRGEASPAPARDPGPA